MSASSQLKYDLLNTSNGLSQGYIYDMLQDKDGFMWLGTKDGLNRFDGYKFKVYTFNSYDEHSLSNNSVKRLFEDSKHRLWVGTNDGLNIYDKKKDHFKRILYDPNNTNSLAGAKVQLPIIELPDGRFLVSTNQHSFNVITIPEDFLEDDKPAKILRLNVLEGKNIENVYKDSKGRVWIVITGQELYEFIPQDLSVVLRKKNAYFVVSHLNTDGSLGTNDTYFSEIEDTVLYPIFTKDIVKKHGCFFLHEKDKQRFWVGITDSGRMEIYDTRNWQRGHPLDPNQVRIASYSDITPSKFYKDKSGSIWVGTNGYGVRKYISGVDKFHHYAVGASVLKIIPFENQLYYFDIGTINKIDVEGNVITTEADIKLGRHESVFIARNNTIWMLQSEKKNLPNVKGEIIINYDPVTQSKKTYNIEVDKIHELNDIKLEDHNGNIWLKGVGGYMLVLDPKSGLFKEIALHTNEIAKNINGVTITALYEDNSGVFWAGTERGLAKIFFNSNSKVAPIVIWYKNNSNEKSAMNYGLVSSILDDPLDKNILWVATKGGGLNRLDKVTNTFTHITTLEGLCNNVVYGILSDDAGNIWGSTNNGIFCLLNNKKDAQSNWQFRHFTKATGLQDNEFNTSAFAKLSNGLLAFGGVNGLNIFNPKEILIDSFVAKTFITNILIGNKPVHVDDASGILSASIESTNTIQLSYTQDVITLEFSTLDFRAPDQNMYRYQLVGIDKDWVESGNRRNVTYSKLQSGTYIFKVQGSNSLGIWNAAITELKIIVLPPWWRTWWAYLIYLLLIVLSVRAYFKFTINREKLKSQLNFEQQEAKRIKELDTIKTQLYANITHEFRTPLTVILGMSNQVKNDPEKHLNSGVDMIIRNGENLLNLVNEMLDLSKLEDGKMPLHLVHADVIAFLRYIVESFQSLAASQQKQFHFLSDIDELVVAFDAEKIRQIITNLFSNALKFTSAQGNVYVSVSQENTDNDQQTALILKVKDTGIGIPENQLQHIFERFYQLDNSHTRKTGGTGIGLALTKELVKLMNGTIEVKSPPIGAVKGTEFIISIPLNLANKVEEITIPITTYSDSKTLRLAERNLLQPTIESTSAASEMPLVLLVEDNADVVAYTASCLPEYKLSVGKDGREGFDIAVNIVPDLIITDVMMPFVDGFEMCRQLKLDVRTSHIPIIMLTAKADMQSKLQGIETGADVYLEKPFHKEELLLRIKKLLENRKHLQQYYSNQIGIADVVNNSITTQVEPVSSATIENAFVIKVKSIVEDNFTNYEFNVEQLCKLIFMSHSQLHRKLDALTGCSPNKFIRTVRLNKAKELLTNPTISIATIALDCGYNDAGYFARVFKQETGLTPQEWRANNAQS
ncbi:MAG: hybrid sensor histidine kinase/response regulator transcription factor [Ferruginibacter sp.]